MKVAILLLAAGRGTRLGAQVPKAYLRLGPAPLLLHSAARLLAAVAPTNPCELLLLVDKSDRDTRLPPFLSEIRSLLPQGSELKIVDGGATRQDSMELGLAATDDDCELVLVHDAARALVSIDRTRACLTTAASTGAALLAIPATDTLKRVRDQLIVETMDRAEIYYAQTPQIAKRDLFLQACKHARQTGYVATDDASLLEHAGIDVTIVEGSSGNLKITHPDDLPLAESLLARDPSPFPA